VTSNNVPLCCFGAGGHGRVVASQWRRVNKGEIVFADERLAIGSKTDGFPVRFSALADVQGHSLIITVGNNGLRRELQQRACELNLRMTSIVIEPERYFGEAPGLGSVVLAGALVNCGARIGAGVIVNSGAVVEHDCEVGDFVHLSPNATLTGGCSIGEESWIGAGAVVLPGISVAARCIVGSGAVVTRNLVRPGIYTGVPARWGGRKDGTDIWRNGDARADPRQGQLT